MILIIRKDLALLSKGKRSLVEKREHSVQYTG